MYPTGDDHPVETVQWDDVVNTFQPGTGLRLPTEAEREYACRAGTTTAYHGWPAQPNGTNDDTLIGDIAWYPGNAYQPQAVGLKAANGFGLHDMAGNVFEWCADRYAHDYYHNSPGIDPQGPSWTVVGDRVNRGGSFYDGNSRYVRSSDRQNLPSGSDGASGNLGFRVARTP